MVLIHKGKLIDLVDAGIGFGGGSYGDGFGFGFGYGYGYGGGDGDGYCNEKDNGLEEIKTR